MKKISSVIMYVLTALLALIVLFNLITHIKRKNGDQCPTVLGFGTAIVISGSMEPEISVNDLIVIFKTDNIDVGDVITYRGNTTPVTHRVIEKGADDVGEYYVTKGDANEPDDGRIYKERVVGKVIFTLDGFGEVQAFMSTTAGFMLLTAIMLLLAFMPELIGFAVSSVKRLSERGKTDKENSDTAVTDCVPERQEEEE